MLRGGVIACTWQHAVASGVLAGLLEWAYFHVTCTRKDDAALLVDLFAPAADVHGTLLPLVSFLLTVYVTDRMATHRSIVEYCQEMPVRGWMLDLALFVGAIIDSNRHDKLHYKYTLHRPGPGHMTMLHYYAYLRIAPDDLDGLRPAHWFRIGLLTHGKSIELEKGDVQ